MITLKKKKKKPVVWMEMLHQEIQDDSSDNHKAAQKQVSYPSHVVDVPYGKALVASIDLEVIICE